MNRFTPGPWRVDANYPSDIQDETGEIEIATCVRLVNGIGDSDIRRANAQLIAAAPCLLEALRWYVANDDTNVQQDGNEFYTAGLRRAEAAIAKATGEQP